MLIFLDTEFTDFAERDLISIGMVSDDGRHEFYAERYDYDPELCSDFVFDMVLPYLGQIPSALCSRHDLEPRLRQWFATLPGEVQIATDFGGDFRLLCNALSHNLPDNMSSTVFDLNPLLEEETFNKAACAYHNEPDHPWHHALHDARGHRAGWAAWMAARTDD